MRRRLCGGDCTIGGYFAFEKANMGIWAEAHPEWSSEIYELEMKLRWNALDEDGKKVFGREGVCEPEPMLVDCGGGEVAESCAACGARHGACGGECHWVRSSSQKATKPLSFTRRMMLTFRRDHRHYRQEGPSFQHFFQNFFVVIKDTDVVWDETAGEWVLPEDLGNDGSEAERQCLAAEGDACRLPTDVCAPRPPPRNPEEDTWAQAKQGFSTFSKTAGQFIKETWPALLVLAIVAFILISQRTVIQHVLHKMSETFFELYIIALTDACVRHALLMGVAVIAWMRVGAPWLPFIFAPVFYGTLLPLWFLLACWLLVCVVVPVWAAHTMHRFGRACYDAFKRRRASARAARDGRNAINQGPQAAVEAVLAGALDAQGPPPGAIHLRIRCDGEIVYFKVGLQVSIGAVFEAFAERKRVGVEALRFRVEGADSDVSDTVPTVGQLGFANLVLLDCFMREAPAAVSQVKFESV